MGDPMTKDKLVELAEACEAAKGPDRELDYAIWLEAGETPLTTNSDPPYTASLDAAMTLVPEGWRTSDFTQWENAEGAWSVMLLRTGFKHQAKDADAKTGPLAIVAAALRARSA